MEYFTIANRSTPNPKAKPVYFSGSYPHIFKDSRVDHSRPEDFNPSAHLADPAATPPAENTGNIDLGTRLGEGKITGAEPDPDLLAEKSLQKMFQRPFEFAETDPLIDGQAFDLLEHRRMRGIRVVMPVDFARADNPQRVESVSPWCEFERGRCACEAAGSSYQCRKCLEDPGQGDVPECSMLRSCNKGPRFPVHPQRCSPSSKKSLRFPAGLTGEDEGIQPGDGNPRQGDVHFFGVKRASRARAESRFPFR